MVGGKRYKPAPAPLNVWVASRARTATKPVKANVPEHIKPVQRKAEIKSLALGDWAVPLSPVSPDSTYSHDLDEDQVPVTYRHRSGRARSCSVVAQPSVFYMPWVASTQVNYILSPPMETESYEHKVPPLRERVCEQILYYFSAGNLVKDMFLRRLFDRSNGSVPLTRVVRFRKLYALIGDDVEMLRTIIEEDCAGKLELVGPDCVRCVNWEYWMIW